MTQAPIVIVGNPASGAGRAREAIDAAAAALRDAGHACEVLLAPQPAALAALARRAVAHAADRGGVVVAAGGDGSVGTVVTALLDRARDANGDQSALPPLGLLPLGTFNYFARTHGVPDEPHAAAALWLQGSVREVQVGCVNERAFLVHAALGLYPRLLEDREAFKRRYGRNRLVAMWAGAQSMWRGDRSITLTIERDGQMQTVRTSTLFIGNNRLQLEQIGVPQAPQVEQGHLVALWLQPTGAWERLWVALRGAVGELGGSDAVLHEVVRELSVLARRRWTRRPMKVALDGEVMRLPLPLRFCIAPQRIMLLAPPPAEPSSAA